MNKLGFYIHNSTVPSLRDALRKVRNSKCTRGSSLGQRSWGISAERTTAARLWALRRTSVHRGLR